MIDLSDKIALVTGASRGIGQSISMILAQNGAHVVCVSRNVNDVQSVADKITHQKFNASAVSCDISDSNNVTELVKDIIEKHGRIDILINNAGITRDNLLMRMQEEDFNQVIKVNLNSVFNMTKAVQKIMLKQRSGSIINMSSVVGVKGNAGQSNYAASKAGIIGFSKSIALELGSRNIRCNVIAPGFIETEMTKKLDEKIIENWRNSIPLKRGGTPVDVANACVWLASDMSSYVTGQVLNIDGGLLT